MLKMVDGTGIIGVDMVCPLGATVSPPQPPNYDNIEMEGVGSLMLPNSLKAPIERLELIGNSVQGENPAPDNPQEIKSAGRKSKNLFNKNAVKQGYEFGSMATDTETVKQGWFVSDFMPVKATTYQISGKKTGNGCKLYSKDKVFVKNIQAPFGGIKFDDGIAYFRINGEIKDLDKIQVEEGTVATDYEPYGYLIDLKVTGKNLFSGYLKDGYYNDSGILTPLHECKTTDFIPIKNVVCTSFTSISERGFRIAEFDANKNFIKRKTVIKNKEVLLLDKNTRYIAASVNYEYYKNIMLEQKDEPSSYEPYTEQTVTLTSDRLITKWDKLVEQGGQIGWLYGSAVKTFESDVFKLYADNDKAIQYQVPFEEITNSWNELVCYCNTFENVIRQTIYTQSGKTDFYMGCVHKSMVFSAKNKQGIFQSIEAFQEWIRNSGTYVWYKTDNKKFVPLLESEQTQLRNLRSYNGTTHITVDSGEVPCGIKLTYRKEI